jgi:hypothetical protein
MRKVAMWILAFCFVAAPAASALAAKEDNKPASSDGSKSTDSSKAPAPTPAPAGNPSKETKPATNGAAPSSAELAAEIEQLRVLILKQAEQLDRQQREMTEMKANLDRISSTASSPAPSTTTGGAPLVVASAAPSAIPAAAPATTPVVAPQGNGAEETSPLQFRIGNAYITPIGFMDFTAVWRNHDGGSGIGTNFAGIPYGNVFQNNLGEFRFSMQNSRIGFRVDAMVKGAHVIGYMESDYLGNNPGNVAVSSNSNTMRSRLYWVDVRKDKWEVLGGQTWSLITPGRAGISPLPGNLFFTQNIDVNYQLGLVWGRIPEVRFVYHPSDKVAFAIALDSPEQYNGGSAGGPTITCPAALGTICTAELNNGGTTLGTPNRTPDVIVKLALDPVKKFHVEVGGVERQFHVWNPVTLAKFSSTGAGGFVNLNFEPFKGFRLYTNNFWSDGGGRYIFGQIPDAIIRADGSLSPIHTGSTVSGVEFTHKNSLLYAYYGGVYVTKNKAFDANGTTPIGYGFAPATPRQNRSIQEGTLGWAQTFWKDGKYGALTMMGQYSYVVRNPWTIGAGQPEDAHLSMVFLNLRYTLPGSAPAIK